MAISNLLYMLTYRLSFNKIKGVKLSWNWGKWGNGRLDGGCGKQLFVVICDSMITITFTYILLFIKEHWKLEAE
jgi:hypothetical protein